MRSSDIRNRTIRVGDLSRKTTRSALRSPDPRAPPDPPARTPPTYRARSINLAAVVRAGTPRHVRAQPVGTNVYRVEFP